jgi:hypothetical protein
MKVEVHPANKPSEPVDIGRIFCLLRQVRYRGYVALEYEGATDPFIAVPQTLRQMQACI